MPSLSPDVTGAAEMLQFLSDWLRSDPGCLAPRWQSPSATPAYGTQHLREDLDRREVLDRFAFLLGGNDGESLFGAAQG